MKVIAIPKNELVFNEEISLWQSTGSDPQFLLGLTELNNTDLSGWLFIEVAIEFKNLKWQPRLYWDDGMGFSEKNSHIMPVPMQGKISVALPFPSKVHALRLDPMDCVGEFSLGEINVRKLSKLGVVISLLRPYARRAIKQPAVYFKVARDLFLLWRVYGFKSIKDAFRHLALTHSGTALKAYIYGKLQAAQLRKSGGYVVSSNKSIRSSKFFMKKSSIKKHIGIGLVEHFGDIVACEPVARYLKKKYPDSVISWVVKSDYRELIDNNPYIDKTISVDCLTDWIRLRAHGAFDQYFDLHVNERICQHCNIPLVKKEGNPAITGNNYFDFGSLLGSFSLGAGLPSLDDAPKVYISDIAERRVDELLLPLDYVVFHCKSNEVYKDWNDKDWHMLANWINTEYDLPVVEVGLQSVLVGHAKGIIDLCSKTSLLETAEVIRRAKIFVGIDSGPGHLANAVETYGVVLLGSINDFKSYNPYTGGFSDGTKALLVRNLDGPVKNIAYDDVKCVIEEAIKNESDFERHHVGENSDIDTVVSINKKETNYDKVSEKVPRLIAFYLPQFHPIEENDTNWGKGFTEWRNVGKSKPFYHGQYQPRLPGELGYYDLRLPEIMEQQADLAREHGIHGFCYYYYWFQGKRLLNVPIDNMLRNKKPDFPFCFCWANENWTRAWDGMEKQILVAQNHTHEDDVNFIRHLIPAFEDPRYIRIDDKPILLVYRTELFPNPKETTEIWREEARKAGIGDLFLVRCEGFDPFTNPEDIGFDASYEVPTFILPDTLRLDDLEKLHVSPDFNGRIFDYKKIVKYYSERSRVQYRRYKDVMLAWDNTPRHGNKSVIFHGVTPELYAEWLNNCMNQSMNEFHGEERLVFVNAWNEWAEGSYLEPDLVYGKQFLEATKSVIDNYIGRHDLGDSRMRKMFP